MRGLTPYTHISRGKKDFKRITLLTDKISADSQHFFKKMGFEYSSMIPMRRIIT